MQNKFAVRVNNTSFSAVKSPKTKLNEKIRDAGKLLKNSENVSRLDQHGYVIETHLHIGEDLEGGEWRRNVA